MKKYLKTLILACVAVCLIACTALFATACTDTSKYEVTIVHEDGTAFEGVKINFCKGTEICLPQEATGSDGKVVVDLTQFNGGDEFHVQILQPKGYEFVTEGLEHDETGIIVNLKDGYSITLTLKAITE
mgnify:CR=1 FL=1